MYTIGKINVIPSLLAPNSFDTTHTILYINKTAKMVWIDQGYMHCITPPTAPISAILISDNHRVPDETDVKEYLVSPRAQELFETIAASTDLDTLEESVEALDADFLDMIPVEWDLDWGQEPVPYYP